MGALQPGLPSPVAIPSTHALIIIDLQDAFFSIPLSLADCRRFAFSLPSQNYQRPHLRFQWKVLPQGMKNSPTLCQKFVALALSNIRQKFPDLYMIHYMDDILLAHDDSKKLHSITGETILILQQWGFKISPEKIQTSPPYSFLGRVLNEDTSVSHQNIQLRMDSLRTLNDYQKLLGEAN